MLVSPAIEKKPFTAEIHKQEQTCVPANSRRFLLAGVPVDCVTMASSVARVIDAVKHRSPASPLLITGPNAHLITLAQSNRQFAHVLRAAHLSIPDGMSVVLASWLLGHLVPERVTGGDLMENLCREAAGQGLSVFLLGGLPGAAEGTAQNLTQRYPALKITGTYCPPYGFESDAVESARIRQLIMKASPDLLCVAFGAPKQEIWMYENCPPLPIGAAIAVGAALDTQAGLRKRAPAWTHNSGLEWLYRLLHEPRRLWRRYLIGNAYFAFLVIRQWLRSFYPAAASTTRTDYPLDVHSQY